MISAGWYINFAWAVGGIIIGYIGGLLINKGDERGDKYRQFGGIIVLVLVTLGAVLNYVNATELRNSVECQRKFNRDYREALGAQVQASLIENKALRDFLEPFRQVDIPGGPARTDRFVVIFDQLDVADKLRETHPIPVNNPCGEGG